MRKRITAFLILVLLALPAVCQPAGLLARAADQAVASVANHSCCPGGHSRTKSFAVANPPMARMPCGNAHLCCMTPGPANAPSLPAAHRTPRPDSKSFPQASGEFNSAARDYTVTATAAVEPSSLASIQSTVLRI